MATLTSTEAGASGRYIQYDQAALDDLGSQTIMVYAKPTGSGGGTFGYLYGKTPSNSTDGLRLFIDDNAASPKLTFGASSTGGAGLPTASTTAGTVTYSAWANFCITWDGTLNGSGINLYIDGTDQRDAGSLTDGTTAVKSDAADPVFIMNRQGLTREHVGDYAYIAIWDRVLNSTERTTARTTGPLDVPTGLVLLFANDADLSTNAFSQVGRSARVTGSTPGNTALGGSANNTIAVPLGELTLTGYAPTVSTTAHQTIAVPKGAIVLTGYAPTVVSTSANVIAVPAGSLVLTGYAPTVSNGEAWSRVSASGGSWSGVSASGGSWSAISPSSGTWTAQ